MAEVVAAHDVDIEVGTIGLETSFRAQVGTGGPLVAILAEYDALHGIGHGCGHNIICAAGVGAFLAASSLVEMFEGTVQLIGTPAEEGGSGKEPIARAGGFAGVDCAMMVHPAGSGTATASFLGMRQVDVSWRGLEAHASAVPFMGRNALDACVTAYNLVGQLRQHMLPEDRVHGVITDGGDKPNIIPDHAAASYYVGSGHVETLVELSERLDAIFTAAATASGTIAEARWDPNPLILPVRNNMALARRFAQSFTSQGKDMPLRSPVPSGSIDMGNVSVRVPSIHPKVGIGAPDVPIHNGRVRPPRRRRGWGSGSYGWSLWPGDDRTRLPVGCITEGGREVGVHRSRRRRGRRGARQVIGSTPQICHGMAAKTMDNWPPSSGAIALLCGRNGRCETLALGDRSSHLPVCS